MSNRVKQLAAAVCGLLLAGALRAETVPQFTGNGYADMNHAYSGLSSVTLETWIKATAVPAVNTYGAIAGNGYLTSATGFGLFLHNNGTIVFQVRQGGTIAQPAAMYPFDDAWHHVAGVYDGNAAILYLDGGEVARVTQSVDFSSVTQVFGIGARCSGSWGFFFAGRVADVRVWNYARSGGEILMDMETRLTGAEAGLLGYWPLDEGEGTTVYDWTAAGSDGTLVGAGWNDDGDLTLALPDAEYFDAPPVALADLVTGSERFTNSNEVDVVEFPVPRGYDVYQVGASGGLSEIDPGGWLPTNAPPARLAFDLPAGDTNLVRYVWFTNTAAAVRLRRAEAAIRYTRTPPLPRTADTYLREMDEAGVEAVLVPASFDWGSAGGESGGETIPLHAFALNLVDGPAADATPEAPFVTLRQTGDYQCGLVVMNAAGNVATSAVFTVGVVPWAGAKTEGDVVWSGGGGTPYWNVAANWQDGAAPSNPTPGTVTFANPGQDQMSVLEADRSVGKLLMGIASTNNCTHTLDLGGHTLRVTNLLQLVNSRQSMRNTLNFTNGTVQVGTDATAADWNVGALGTLCFMPSTILDARNLGVMQISFSAYGTVYMDLRGATVAGGALRVRRLLMNGGGWYSNQMFIDSATDMDALEIAELLEMGKSTTTTAKTPQYIGDPADPFAFDGATMGRLPAGISLRLGKSVTQRVNMIMMEQGYASGSINRTAICVAPGGGGVFTGYLSDLVISRRTGSNVIKIRALLDVAEMDSCELDILDLQIAPGRPNAVATDDEQGEMKLPQGTATVANATLGADGGVGFGRLTLSNTVVTVTNSLVLNKTGRITISTDNTSRGLTVEKGFTDADGTVTVHFLEQPVPGATNWALRIRGNVRNTLNSMIGTGRLVCNIAGGITGKRVGIVADDDYTYCALVDDTLAFDPVALVRNRTFEIAPSGDVVRIAPSEVDNGSLNPEDPQAPVQLRLVYNGGPQTNELVFTAAGSYAVTLVANIMENDTVIASASDSATITVVTPPSGTTNTVEWCGTAATVLMSDRPEWFWSGNWVGQEPPANPFPGTVFYRTLGQNVQGKLDADRRVAALSFGQDGYSVTHALDLAGKTLTIENQLLLAGKATTQLTFTNGTVQLGTAATTLNLTVQNNGVFKWSPGTTLDSCNINELKLASAAWAHIPVLDLRGATISGGALAVRKLLMPSTSWYGARLYIDAATALTTIRVNEALELGRGSLNENVPAYIGDPDDAFVWETKTFGRLPAGINLVVGDAPAMRAGMVLVEQTYGSNSSSAAIRAAPGGGGAFRAFLSSLQMALRGATGSVKTRALLDLSAMDYCEFDVLDLLIAPGRESAEPTDDERGELWLPPGTATVANAVIGAADGVGHGMLVLSNTTMSVTNRMTLNRTARVSVSVGAAAGGLLIEPADAAALTVAEGAQLTLRFAEAASVRPHYALRWTGDHAATVNGWLDAGTLVIDDEGLGRAAAVFVSGPATYVGLPPAGGTVLLLR